MGQRHRVAAGVRCAEQLLGVGAGALLHARAEVEGPVEGAAAELPALAQELAIYPVDADVEMDGQRIVAHTLAVLTPGQVCSLRSSAAVRLMVLGGDALDGHRHMWWNFVSSDPARIEEAAQRWAAGGFDAMPGETDRIAAPPWRGMRPK